LLTTIAVVAQSARRTRRRLAIRDVRLAEAFEASPIGYRDGRFGRVNPALAAITELPNRRGFQRRLGALIDHRATGAVMLIDLDHFKAINDTYGHDCGDQVLRRIGELMRVGTRPDDVAIRHGGDEFAILLRDERLTNGAAWQRAHEIRDTIAKEPWFALSPGLVVTVTVGVAVAPAPIGDEPPPEPIDIYRAADRALYAAKSDGSGIIMAEVSGAGRAR